MNDHLEIARGYLAIAESDDSEREAYEKAADAIIAWQTENPTRTLRDADRILGRGNDYTGRLVRWRTSGAGRAPFVRAGDDRNARATRQTIRERPEIIDALLEEGGEAALLISRAVHKRDRAEQEEQAEERRKQDELTAPTLPFYARTLLEQMRKMERAMAAITEDDLLMLAELPGVDDLVEAAERLQMQVARWQLQLGGRIAIDQDGTITIEVD